MKIRYFALALESDDFEKSTIVSDFNFQTAYMSDYIQKHLRRQKFETENFDIITIRGRKEPVDSLVFKSHFKSLNIEVFFDEAMYRELYPYENAYPLYNKLLKPVKKTKEFNDFLISMIMQGIEKGRKLNAPIPDEFLINTVLDFKASGCKNEWVHKAKTFKEYGIKATLFCILTANYFFLELIVERNKQELLRREILRTKPHSIHYKHEFKDLVISDGKLIVTKDMYENPILFELPLSEIG